MTAKTPAIGELIRTGALYDEIYRHVNDIPFYVKQAKRAQSVLELCCGTGRITLPIAAAGVDITGVDFSESMLAQAKKKAAAQQRSITFHLADLRQLDLPRKFDLVIIPFNSLEDFYTDEDFGRVMSAVKRHLSPKGMFVFDVNNPQPKNLKEGRRTVPLTKAFTFNGTPVKIDEKMVYDETLKINRVVRAYEIDGVRSEVPLDLRVYFPDELASLVTAAGFKIVQRHGDFDESPLTATGLKQILTLTAR